LEGGPPMFRQDFTCPALLKDSKISTRTGLSPTKARLSRRFRLINYSHWPGPRSLATTSGVSVDVLSSGYLDVSVPRVCSLAGTPYGVGCPIQKSTDQSLFAAPHGLSQRITSFIASCRQGIHRMPLRHLITLIINVHLFQEPQRLLKRSCLLCATASLLERVKHPTNTEQNNQQSLLQTNQAWAPL
jgi:hypothetical protein